MKAEEIQSAAVSIAESVKPELSAKEQALFIAGFQECIKWLVPETAQQVEERERIIDEIQGVLYKMKTDEADDGSWIESKDFYSTAEAIYNIMLLDGTIERMKKVAPEPVVDIEQNLSQDLEFVHSTVRNKQFDKGFRVGFLAAAQRYNKQAPEPVEENRCFECGELLNKEALFCGECRKQI